MSKFVGLNIGNGRIRNQRKAGDHRHCCQCRQQRGQRQGAGVRNTDDDCPDGKGTHERFIIDVDKFIAKAESK